MDVKVVCIVAVAVALFAVPGLGGAQDLDAFTEDDAESDSWEAEGQDQAEVPDEADGGDSSDDRAADAGDGDGTGDGTDEQRVPAADEVGADGHVRDGDPDRIAAARRTGFDAEEKNGFYRPISDATLSWAGSMLVDAGYAQYTFESVALNTERVHDFRGRFVFGPTAMHTFGDDWFVAARGEAVMWVREQFGVYQINVDDAFAQVGKLGLWDLKVGRFRAWRVYHRGLGFDLFTLEDTGACVQNPCTADAGTFGPHMYEVSYIYDRETPGRAAAHFFPTEWAGFELLGVYGQSGVSNAWGMRAAGMVYFDFLRVMAAAEYRGARPREEASSLDPNTGMEVECLNCGASERSGFGGGIELIWKPVEVGFNMARGNADVHTVTDGSYDQGASNTITTLGGYAEFDLGWLWDESLVLGVGWNRTEQLAVNENFTEHTQAAAYIAYPLGFNNAIVKLVLSRADLSGLTLVDEANRIFNESKSAMSAARLRLFFPF